MISVPRRQQHPSSDANRPSDVPVTVNFNAEYKLMAVNFRLEWFLRDLIPEYSQGLESSTIHTAPQLFVESKHCRSNRILSRLPLHLHPEEIIPTFVKSNIYIRLCFPKPSPWHDSGRTKCRMSCESSEWTKLWAFGEFLTSDSEKRHFWTGRQHRFRSRGEFRSLYNTSSELHPFRFAEQFSRWRYQSMCDFHPVHYTATVNKSSNGHTS